MVAIVLPAYIIYAKTMKKKTAFRNCSVHLLLFSVSDVCVCLPFFDDHFIFVG